MQVPLPQTSTGQEEICGSVSLTRIVTLMKEIQKWIHCLYLGLNPIFSKTERRNSSLHDHKPFLYPICKLSLDWNYASSSQ